MRLLVTNDDGIESEGIHALARVLHDAGHDVVVAAPDRDHSGAGAAIGRVQNADGVEATEVELPGRPAVRAWTLAGPPGLCVLAGRLGAFGEQPDVVVAGINAGTNTGRSILHSGTVGAALTAQNFGLSGLAVSLRSGPRWHWDTAATCALRVLELLRDAPPRSVLNLNVPAVEPDALLGTRWARLAPFGGVRAAMADVRGGRLQIEMTATGEGPAEDTDTATVRAGYASLTTLVGVVEAWPDRPGRAAPEVHEEVVPGAPLEAVHRVPDASDTRALRRPDAAPR